jgi:DNA-binding MarR family transcriptional regulator
MTVRNPAEQDSLPDHLPRWLDAASRRLRSDLGAQDRSAFPGLRGSHQRILQMIPPGGIRITDLAVIAGMTKQSLGEFADGLEEAGFTRSQRDKADRRVRLILRTPLGDQAAEVATRAIAAVEAQWRAEVGPGRYDVMKQVLRELGRDSFRT